MTCSLLLISIWIYFFKEKHTSCASLKKKSQNFGPNFAKFDRIFCDTQIKNLDLEHS
jgi:hypothetical protein